MLEWLEKSCPWMDKGINKLCVFFTPKPRMYYFHKNDWLRVNPDGSLLPIATSQHCTIKKVPPKVALALSKTFLLMKNILHSFGNEDLPRLEGLKRYHPTLQEVIDFIKAEGDVFISWP